MQMNESYELLRGKKIGFALTGSFCTLEQTMQTMRELTELGAELMPIVSFNVRELDTKFGPAEKWHRQIVELCGREPIDSISKAEPIGPQSLLDILLVLPCSGNTLGKLANGITDTPVCMAVKAHLRNDKPVVIGVSTNDGLGVSAANIGRLMNNQNIFMVPFGQDAPHKKKNSLVCDFAQVAEALVEALQGRQLQPVLREFK